MATWRSLPSMDPGVMVETTGHSYGERYPNPEDGHVDGCEIQDVLRDGVRAVGIVCCAHGCPHLQRTLERGRQLAEEHGW